MARTSDVVVLGAGVAGLAAARVCHAANLQVVLVEGRNRVGGRVLTDRDPETGHPTRSSRLIAMLFLGNEEPAVTSLRD